MASNATMANQHNNNATAKRVRNRTSPKKGHGNQENQPRNQTPTKPKAKRSSPASAPQTQYYAGGAYCNSPAPSAVPLPSNLLKSTGSPASSCPSSPALSHSDMDCYSPPPSPPPSPRNEATEDLIGSMLLSMVASQCGGMEGKVVGMLLELSDDQIAVLMRDSQKRNQVVADALDLLREQSVISSMAPIPMQPMNQGIATAC